jgi:hypothetical protein
MLELRSRSESHPGLQKLHWSIAIWPLANRSPDVEIFGFTRLMLWSYAQ